MKAFQQLHASQALLEGSWRRVDEAIIHNEDYPCAWLIVSPSKLCAPHPQPSAPIYLIMYLIPGYALTDGAPAAPVLSALGSVATLCCVSYTAVSFADS